MAKVKFNWGTTIALIVSFSALITTIYEANILKSQQHALVWPYLEVEQSYTSEGFGFVAKNSGTGPAIVTSVEFRHGNTPFANFMDLLDILSPDSSINYYNYTYRDLNSSVFRPGEERVIFFMKWTPYNRALLNKAEDLKVTVEFKSVLDDYWVYNSEQGKSVPGRFKSSLEFTTSR